MTIVQWLLFILISVLIALSLDSIIIFFGGNLYFLAFCAGLVPYLGMCVWNYLWARFSPESYRAALFKVILRLDKVIAERKKAAHDKAASDSDVSDGERFYD